MRKSQSDRRYSGARADYFQTASPDGDRAGDQRVGLVVRHAGHDTGYPDYHFEASVGGYCFTLLRYLCFRNFSDVDHLGLSVSAILFI